MGPPADLLQRAPVEPQGCVVLDQDAQVVVENAEGLAHARQDVAQLPDGGGPGLLGLPARLDVLEAETHLLLCGGPHGKARHLARPLDLDRLGPPALRDPAEGGDPDLGRSGRKRAQAAALHRGNAGLAREGRVHREDPRIGRRSARGRDHLDEAEAVVRRLEELSVKLAVGGSGPVRHGLRPPRPARLRIPTRPVRRYPAISRCPAPEPPCRCRPSIRAPRGAPLPREASPVAAEVTGGQRRQARAACAARHDIRGRCGPFGTRRPVTGTCAEPRR